MVLAVPSDDFNQDLATAEEVKEFCEMNCGIDMSMADISHVIGANEHPFYKAVKAENGFAPWWNFNKVLIDGDGVVVGTWVSNTKPDAPAITRRIEPILTT